MFICYLDESGHTGPNGWADQRVLIVGGVLVNTYRAPKTRRDWKALLVELGDLAGNPLTELKGRELFRGVGAWGQCGHQARTEARIRLLEWLRQRGHKLVASGVQYDLRQGAVELCPEAHALRPYVAAGLHAGLMIQRSQHSPQDQQQNKNLTLLMYDRQEGGLETELARLLASPPEWGMDFVRGRSSEDDELPAVLDTAYFADSKQAPLIQLADFVCYMIQRKAVLDCGVAPSFEGEAQIIESVWARLEPLLIARTHRLPTGPRRFSQYMRAVSPEALAG